MVVENWQQDWQRNWAFHNNWLKDEELLMLKH